jgi:hypothetical protein
MQNMPSSMVVFGRVTQTKRSLAAVLNEAKCFSALRR